MRAKVFNRVFGRSVQYVFGIKHSIWPNVACPTSYDAMTPASLHWLHWLQTYPTGSTGS